MKLLDRINELRNKTWYSPLYTLQALLEQRRNQNQLITIAELLFGIYRIFAGRLDKPTRWQLGPIIMKDLDSPIPSDDYPINKIEGSSSKNHIGIFSILFSFLEIAETAMRGNMARLDKVRKNLTLSTLPLWGLINITRALFGVIGTVLSLLPAGIFYLYEKFRINKLKKAEAARELELMGSKVELDAVDVMKKLQLAENEIKVKDNKTYWVIKQKAGNFSKKLKTTPIKKDGKYTAIFSHKHNYEHFEQRLEDTLGNKFEVDVPHPHDKDSPLAKASIFKTRFKDVAAKGNPQAKNPYDTKYIYIPSARTSFK